MLTVWVKAKKIIKKHITHPDFQSNNFGKSEKYFFDTPFVYFNRQ